VLISTPDELAGLAERHYLKLNWSRCDPDVDLELVHDADTGRRHFIRGEQLERHVRRPSPGRARWSRALCAGTVRSAGAVRSALKTRVNSA